MNESLSGKPRVEDLRDSLAAIKRSQWFHELEECTYPMCPKCIKLGREEERLNEEIGAAGGTT